MRCASRNFVMERYVAMMPADAQAIEGLELALQRSRMVRHLSAHGITDDRVLAVFRAVPREEFVPAALRDRAYDDRPLPIGADQTISQPYIVALMAEALCLKGSEVVLDVGTGSGYAAAILSRLAKGVLSIERIPELAQSARKTLARIHYENIVVVEGDGTLGLRAYAPYDAISVAASSPAIPQPLLDQLKVGGRLVIPIGPDHTQTLYRVTRLGEHQFRHENMGEVQFVPLVGEHAWH
jgi:protein-L-isoaspartate(D-aspartate) O-methyltransferase